MVRAGRSPLFFYRPSALILSWSVLFSLLAGCDKMVKNWVGSKNDSVVVAPTPELDATPTPAPTATPAIAWALGQPDDNTIVQLKLGMALPTAATIVGSKLIVTEYINNRVLIWNTFPTTNTQSADLVLGQPDTSSGVINNGGVSAKSIRGPLGVSSDGTRLLVADTVNNRILIWNSIPTTNQQAADLVLGQPNMTSNTANNGGVSAQSLSVPRAAYISGTKLVVLDNGNSRALIWNSFPTTNQQAADVVLGQPNMTSNTTNNGGVSAQSLSVGESMSVAGSKIFVADRYNHRILIWNSIPTANQQAADIVLGQPNMTSSTANNGGVSAQSLSAPCGIFCDGARLMSTECSNNRTLIWNSIPTVNQQAADIVLGQPDMISNTANNGGISSQTHNLPLGLTTDGTRLVLAEWNNSRVLIWNSFPTTNQKAADVVLGQPNMTSSGAGVGGALSGQIFGRLYQPHTDGTHFFVPDYDNHRVLVWNSLPSTSQVPADIVLGQPGMTTKIVNNGGLSAQSLNAPIGVTTSGSKLFVAEYSNHRILVWNSIPSSNQAAADFVLGQPNLTSNTANNGGVTAQGLSGPHGLFVQGNKLFVVEYGNHRVLIWNSIPTSIQQAADVVIGQPNMTSNTADNGGITAQSLKGPVSVGSDGTRLFVSDWDNSRILIWNSIPTANFQAADVVLGQPNMTGGTANNGGISGQTLKNPHNVRMYNGRLYIADYGNNRILIWNSIPTSNGQVADSVLGQPDMVSSGANYGGVGYQSFNGPVGLLFNGLKFYISDYANYRVLVRPIP